MMATNAVEAITLSLPPASDYLTYLTIVESNLSPEILPSLNNLLQDPELTQNIGWDLIQLLLPIRGAEACLNTIARLGNPREVILKTTEALQLLNVEDEGDDEGGELVEEEEEEVEEVAEESTLRNEDTKLPAKSEEVADEKKATASGNAASDVARDPTSVDKFCTLLGLLSILHPRIKTKYPSRFLSTSMMAVLSAYRPTEESTMAVMSFVHNISGRKRPPLPGRKSSRSITTMGNANQTTAPDPEAQDEDPDEAAIQTKLLQSFITHVLDVYINANGLEWSVRLRENFEPAKIVLGRKSSAELYRDDPMLQARDSTTGQLMALARDSGLTGHSFLFDAIQKAGAESEVPAENGDDADDTPPSSPDDVPLSQVGCLFVIAHSVFSSFVFGSNSPLPPFSIFPHHAKLVQHFIGTDDPENIGTEPQGVIDAIVALGLWLEHSDRFVSKPSDDETFPDSGPLEDEDFLKYLQSISLLSANNPSSNLRYTAHLLVSSVLHSHPDDRIRLTFISDTLENCPYETLMASAVSWLKEEIITAHKRDSDNVFSSPVALVSVQPYLFPNTAPLLDATHEEACEELRQQLPFYMAILNFVIFISNGTYAKVVPSGMLQVAEEIYLGPLLKVQNTLETSLAEGGELHKRLGAQEYEASLVDVRLLGDRLLLYMES